jgi:hypothetical protein
MYSNYHYLCSCVYKLNQDKGVMLRLDPCLCVREEVLLSITTMGQKKLATLLKMEGTPDGILLFHSFWKEPPIERFRESLCYYPERRDCEISYSEDRRG